MTQRWDGRAPKGSKKGCACGTNSHHPHHLPLTKVLAKCRLRFGIESSYRELSDSRIRTSTRDPKLRVLYVATSLLLVNSWVEKKWTRFSTKRRGPGGKTVHEDLLPYARFLAMLQYILERNYEFILAVEVPERRLTAGLVGRWFTNY